MGEGGLQLHFVTREEASMSRGQRPRNSRPRGSAVTPIAQCIEEGGGASPDVGLFGCWVNEVLVNNTARRGCGRWRRRSLGESGGRISQGGQKPLRGFDFKKQFPRSQPARLWSYFHFFVIVIFGFDTTSTFTSCGG